MLLVWTWMDTSQIQVRSGQVTSWWSDLGHVILTIIMCWEIIVILVVLTDGTPSVEPVSWTRLMLSRINEHKTK